MDLVNDILTSEVAATSPLVELASAKSGLRVSFDSNRE